MKRKKTAKASAAASERRGASRRITTERRNKSRWDPKAEDRRQGFGRRNIDKLWERLVSDSD
jgi:hypothetical protein